MALQKQYTTLVKKCDEFLQCDVVRSLSQGTEDNLEKRVGKITDDLSELLDSIGKLEQQLDELKKRLVELNCRLNIAIENLQKQQPANDYATLTDQRAMQFHAVTLTVERAMKCLEIAMKEKEIGTKKTKQNEINMGLNEVSSCNSKLQQIRDKILALSEDIEMHKKSNFTEMDDIEFSELKSKFESIRDDLSDPAFIDCIKKYSGLVD